MNINKTIAIPKKTGAILHLHLLKNIKFLLECRLQILSAEILFSVCSVFYLLISTIYTLFIALILFFQPRLNILLFCRFQAENILVNILTLKQMTFLFPSTFGRAFHKLQGNFSGVDHAIFLYRATFCILSNFQFPINSEKVEQLSFSS